MSRDPMDVDGHLNRLELAGQLWEAPRETGSDVTLRVVHRWENGVVSGRYRVTFAGPDAARVPPLEKGDLVLVEAELRTRRSSVRRRGSKRRVTEKIVLMGIAAAKIG